MRRVPDLHGVVIDVEVRELLRLALEDDGVVARVLEAGAEEAVGLRRRGAVRQGAARDDREPARPPDREPRQRTGGEDEAIVGMVPVHLGPDFVVEDLGAEADAAEILPHVVGAPRLGPDLARGEIHAQEPARVAAGQRRGGRGLLLLARPAVAVGSLDRITHWGSSGERLGRPRTVWGKRRAVVCVARKAGLTSKGLRSEMRLPGREVDFRRDQPLQHADVIGRPDVARRVRR